MKLFHYHFASGNFGDDLNLVFWNEILPGWQDVMLDAHLVGIGTILNNDLPPGPKLVVGSGVGYGPLPRRELMQESRIISVRGPATARALGLPEQLGVVDPAVLVSDMAEHSNVPKSGRPVYVPHISAVNTFNWERICDAAGLDYLSPAGKPEAVIRSLAAAPLVIAESMHAAIIADALRTPWHAFAMAPKFNAFKWLDWAESLEINLKIERPTWQRGRQFDTSVPESSDEPTSTSPERTFDNRKAGLVEKLGMEYVRDRLKARMLVRQFADLARRQGNLSKKAILDERKAELRRRYATLLGEGGLLRADIFEGQKG